MPYLWAHATEEQLRAYETAVGVGAVRHRTREIGLPVSYAVDLWGDNHEHDRPREAANKLVDNGITKRIRYNFGRADGEWRMGSGNGWKQHRQFQAREIVRKQSW